MFDVVKVASADEAGEILSRIYQEKPAFWSNGLTKQHFDGGLWLIRKSASREAVGFVGWQERTEPDRQGYLQKVGYYSIGVIPEERGNGFAKKAVAQILREKSSGVDVVRALIHPDNGPSIRLAESLGVDILKEASMTKEAKALLSGVMPAIAKALRHTGASAAAGGVAVPVVNDMYLHPGKALFDKSQWDDKRIADFTTNALLGLAGGASVRHGMKTHQQGLVTGGVSSMLAAPYIKPLLARTPGLIDAKSDQLRRPAPTPAGNGKGELLKGLLAGGGLSALIAAGILGKGFLRQGEERNQIQRSQTGPRAKLTLPTRQKGDVETAIDLPVGDIRLSNNILAGLGRDTRRRLREETGGRKKIFKGEKARAKNLGIMMNDEAEVLEGREAA